MQAKEKSYFEILDIDEHATEKEIKVAYGKMLRQYPNEQYPKKFQQINTAYRVLSDPKKRQSYLKEFQQDDTYEQLMQDINYYISIENHYAVLDIVETLVRQGYEKDKQVLFLAVKAAILADEYKLAMQYLSDLKKYHEDSEDVQGFLIEAYTALKEYDEAIYFANQLCKKNPKDNHPFIYLVNLYKAKNDDREASRLLEKRIANIDTRTQNYPVLHIGFLTGVEREYMPLIESVVSKLKNIAKKEKDQLLRQMIEAGEDIYQEHYAYKAFILLVEELNDSEFKYVTEWIYQGKMMFNSNIDYFELYPKKVNPVEKKPIKKNIQPVQQTVQKHRESSPPRKHTNTSTYYDRGSILWSIIFGVIAWVAMGSFISGLFIGIIWYFFAEWIKNIISSLFAVAGCLIVIIIGFVIIVSIFS